MVSTGGSVAGYQWDGNVWYRDPTAAAWWHDDTDYSFDAWRSATRLGSTDQAIAIVPAATKVVVCQNKYESGRAFIVVHNSALRAAVDVDLSGVLRPGGRFEIRNVQDVFGPPVVAGTYAGGEVAIPMSGVAAPVPIGRPTRQAPKTGPRFDVFLLTSG